MSIDYTEPITETESLVRPERSWEDGQEYSLRPTRLSEYIGQAEGQGQPGDLHPGCQAPSGASGSRPALRPSRAWARPRSRGIIANEMNVNIRTTSGPAIEKPGDLAALLTNLQENDILFIDEIHRMNRTVEEILYPAMEDYAIDIIIGKGPSANSIRLDLPRFTLVGATTRAGSLSAPLRDRFGVSLRLELYTPQELAHDRHPQRRHSGCAH